jgi:hypothetical protein
MSVLNRGLKHAPTHGGAQLLHQSNLFLSRFRILMLANALCTLLQRDVYIQPTDQMWISRVLDS